MLLLDANVILAAHRDDHPLHAAVRRWFDQTLEGDEPFGIPALAWHTFLRIATNRRIFAVPTPRADAFEFMEATCAQPLHVAVAAGARHLALLRELCEEADAVGDLVPDAVLGAVALEYDCDLITLDRDFARFPSVRHRRPA